jgi:thiol:disulfide interchange protein
LLMFLTMGWLLWVLSRQVGSTVTHVMGISLGLLTLGAWFYGIAQKGTGASTGPRNLRRISVVCIVAAFIVVVIGLGQGGEAGLKPSSLQVSEWERYTAERIEELKRQGMPFLIDFTAAWCLTCQVNERIVFQNRRVQEKIRESGIVLVKADWTSRDPEITRALQRYGRNGVPLYVLHGTKNTQPRLLPEILTPQIVLDALNDIE